MAAIDAGSTVLPPRLFTAHGTVLYIDPGSGELRHGQHQSSPANVRLTSDGMRVEIVHVINGSYEPVICLMDSCRTINSGGAADGASKPTVFELVALYQDWVGLRSGDAFLSAIPDGRVTLSATVCQAWENFLLSDPPPTPLKYSPNSARMTRPTFSISCIETRDPAKAVRAIESTAACINVDCLYWFSTSPYPKTLKDIEITNVIIPEITDFFDDINRVFLQVMPKMVTTDFNLIVQPDGFAVNPQAWDGAFLEYDYIGAPWTWMWGGGPYWRGPIVGNGGFSLRSRKLYHALREIDFKWRPEDWSSDARIEQREYYVTDQKGRKHLPEDILISLWYRQQLEEKFAIKFCPPELASKFCVETVGPSTQYWLGRSFGFHGVAAAPHYGVIL
jgi:hypothetical protein